MSLLGTLFLLAASTALYSIETRKDSQMADIHKDVYLLSQIADEVMSNEERIYVANVRCEGANEDDIVVLKDKLGTVDMDLASNGSIAFRYSTHRLQSLSSFLSWIEEAATDLKALNLVGTWNIHIEGSMRKGNLHMLLAPVELYICAVEVESSYAEKQYNTNYYSGLFHGFRMIENECSNLQIIAKCALPDEQWKITMGTPAIINEPYDVH
ncbi:hypothetical protein [Paenibacillus sp. FSL L8-0709]|uniref:hypothetical protein n=1 Tax=Paenibacillus sp. FSL L8-0709 TaxID=2975312 RepID=UPI0030F7636F